MKKIFYVVVLLSVAITFTSFSQNHKSIMQIELAKYDSLEKAGINIYKKAKVKNKSNVYANCTLNKKVFGWFPYWQGTTYQNFEWTLISDLSYFAYEVDPNNGGAISTHNFETASVIDEALVNGVNVSLCVTLFSNHSTFLNSSTAKQNLINNLINLVSTRGINGVNIDFEGVPSSLRTEFNNFLVDLATAFHSQIPGSQVSVALYAVDWNDVFDESLLNNYLDLFIIMGYDYYYSGSSTAGPTDPLYEFVNGSILNLSKTINYYLNEGISNEKLLLGLPYYGFDYPTSSSSLYASTTGSGSAKTFSTVMDNDYGYYSNSNLDYNSYSNYYVYNNGSWHQCFINNRETLEKRLSLINEYNIGGMGIWALGYDDGYMDYWDAIANRFSDCSSLCSDTIFDNGGPTRNYYNSTDYSFTISQQNAQGLRISFEMLDLEAGYDSLWIYDGPNDNYPLLANLSGNSIPQQPIITSSNTATIKFHSDNATVGQGWKLYWECINDNVLPTTIINAPNWVHSDFVANFVDWDDIGIKDKFALYSVKNINGIWETFADSGMFYDDFEYSSLTQNTSWTLVEGNWSLSQGVLNQTDESLSNTNVYFPVKQTLGGKILISWRMKIGGTGSNRRAGLHFFIDHPDSSNRDNNYMVYFRVDQNAVQIYKYINNSYNLMTNDNCTVNPDTWYDYKVIYDPQTGNLKVFQNNILVSQWTDSTPLQIGDYISLRTGNAIVSYDDIRVFHERNFNSKAFSVSQNTTSIVHYENSSPNEPRLLISSVVTDSAGNFSSTYDKFVNVDFSAPSMVPPINDGTSNDIDTLYDNNLITANWQDAIDYNDSIDAYFVAVGSYPFGSDVIEWHNVGNSTLFDTSGITLNFNSTYYTSVFCINKAGLQSDTICSDGIVVISPSQPPSANFYVNDSTICVGDTIQFHSTSQLAAGYLWIFEGGTPYYSIESNPQVTYSSPGYYDVTLIVTNQISSDTMTVDNLIFVEGKPIAQFTADQTEGVQPLEVTFDNTSTNSYIYQWDFGDGSTSNEINPTHIYNVVASYDVMLIAGNNSCTSDTLIRPNYITVITDIDETQYNSKIIAYPIPTKNSLTIKTNNPEINNIKIINLKGQVIIDVDNFKNEKTFDLKHISPGYYFVLIFDKSNKMVESIKIEKN